MPRAAIQCWLLSAIVLDCGRLGLPISNRIGTPVWLLAGSKTELFIKTGLVPLVADILFGKIVVFGSRLPINHVDCVRIWHTRDTDGDNDMDGDDIQEFVRCFIEDDLETLGCPCADMNTSTAFEYSGVIDFVECLLGDCPYQGTCATALRKYRGYADGCNGRMRATGGLSASGSPLRFAQGENNGDISHRL